MRPKKCIYFCNTLNNETKTLIEFWDHLSEVLEPRSNYRLARLQLEKMKQAKDELIDEYMTKCMPQAKKCKFRDEIEINTRLIEQIIRGGAHDKVREELLCKIDTLTLDKAMQIARTYEVLQQELNEFKAGSNTHIDHVSNILSDNKLKTAYLKTSNRPETHGYPVPRRTVRVSILSQNWSLGCGVSPKI